MAVSIRPAGADSVGDLRAQATTVAEELVRAELEVDADQQQYSVVSQRLAADGQAVAATEGQITDDERRVWRDTGRLRQDAVDSYMSAGSGAPSADVVLFSGSADEVSLAREYGSIAAGNVQDVLDRLHGAEASLRVRETALRHIEAVDQADEATQSAALTAATDTARQEEAVQSTVTGELAAAVSAEAAARSAAAAAAVRAAEARATTRPPTAVRRPSSTTPSTTSSTAGPVSTASPADPALNAYLQCVVARESGGDYQDVSPNGMYMGAFQFSQSTWNMAAQAAGLPGLVGVPPNEASKADQDAVAVALYALDGDQPWLGDRCT